MTQDTNDGGRGIGGRIAPPRFLLFGAVALVAVPAAAVWLGWRLGTMLGFDVAGGLFLLSVVPLFGRQVESIRRAAMRNDANRAALLAITAGVMLVVTVSVAAELARKGATEPGPIALILGTLTLVWVFSNVVYALHYAHLFYLPDAAGKEYGGLDFPGTTEPDYWDFVYFSFTLGMTFQTSDVTIASRRMRRVVLFHTLAAFAFNLGIVAFTINVLGGG